MSYNVFVCQSVGETRKRLFIRLSGCSSEPLRAFFSTLLRRSCVCRSVSRSSSSLFSTSAVLFFAAHGGGDRQYRAGHVLPLSMSRLVSPARMDPGIWTKTSQLSLSIPPNYGTSVTSDANLGSYVIKDGACCEHQSDTKRTILLESSITTTLLKDWWPPYVILSLLM